jgi:hypothetical protein
MKFEKVLKKRFEKKKKTSLNPLTKPSLSFSTRPASGPTSHPVGPSLLFGPASSARPNKSPPFFHHHHTARFLSLAAQQPSSPHLRRPTSYSSPASPRPPTPTSPSSLLSLPTRARPSALPSSSSRPLSSPLFLNRACRRRPIAPLPPFNSLLQHAVNLLFTPPPSIPLLLQVKAFPLDGNEGRRPPNGH